MSDENNKKKNLKIINGNISDLNISTVSEHITPAKPKKKNSTNNIVIPEEKKK